MPTMLSPQFSSRVHSPRFGEAAPSTPTPPNTPTHAAVHSSPPASLPVEDKFESDSNKSENNTPTHTPPASPPPGKVAPDHSTEGTEKPKSEKQEILEHLANMDKKGMKPVFMLFAPKDDQVKTKPGSPEHAKLTKTKWEDLSPAKRCALASMAAVVAVVTTIVAGVLYALTAPIRWLFGGEKNHTEHKESHAQAAPKQEKPKESAAEKTKPATQHEPKHAAAVAKPEVVAKKDEPTPKE